MCYRFECILHPIAILPPNVFKIFHLWIYNVVLGFEKYAKVTSGFSIRKMVSYFNQLVLKWQNYFSTPILSLLHFFCKRAFSISNKTNYLQELAIRPNKQAAFLVGSNLISNILSYIFLLSMARLLPPDSFSSMQSLFSVLMIGMMAGLPVRLAVAKSFASGAMASSEARNFVVSRFYQLRFWILGAFILSWIISPTVSDILGIHNKIAVFFILLCLLLDLSLQFLQAVFQGTFHFRRLGYLTIINPFFKLLFSVILLVLASSYLSPDTNNQQVAIPALGLFLSTLITVIIGIVFIRQFKSLEKNQEANQEVNQELKNKIPENGIKLLTLDTFLLTALHLSFSIISQIDIIIANKYLPPSER